MKVKSGKFLKLDKDFDLKKIKPEKVSKATLYVHIPFCKNLCPYCSFTRYEYDEKKANAYFKSLKDEISFYKRKGFHFSNAYFGGGTPTIDMNLLIEAIMHIKKCFGISEISVETTIKEVNEENLKRLKEAGVTRLSIGIQSFDKKMLKLIGRENHYSPDILDKIKIANKTFDTLNIDMIFNFPGQTLKVFEKDLDTVKKLGVSQVTFYPLMPNNSTKTAIVKNFNRIDTKKEKEFYSLIQKKLEDDKSAYQASTVWCYSKGKRPIDEYFIDHEDYIGVGAGAISFTGHTFRINSLSLEKYGQAIKKRKMPVIFCKPLSSKDHMQYYILTKLFGGAIDKREFERKFGRDIGSAMMFEINGMKLLGWISEDKDKIILTDKGRFCISSLEKEFFSGLNKLREYCAREKL